jgi:hypothetical protein
VVLESAVTGLGENRSLSLSRSRPGNFRERERE